jgi:hypothetical protein
MKKASKGLEKGARIGAALLVLVAVAVIFFASSSIVRISHRTAGGPDESIPSGIRVEVLNGSEYDGAARKVAVALREKGFDVVNIDNAESHDFAKTVVVDRVSSDMRYARLLARRIGCGEVVAQPDPSLYLEVTVIVGNDCGKLFPGVTTDE